MLVRDNAPEVRLGALWKPLLHNQYGMFGHLSVMCLLQLTLLIVRNSSQIPSYDLRCPWQHMQATITITCQARELHSVQGLPLIGIVRPLTLGNEPSAAGLVTTTPVD